VSLKNKFCDRPFRYLEIGYPKDTGEILCHACCPTQLPLSVGDLSKESIDEVWNSENFKEIRSSIIDGSFKHCISSRCPEIQSNALPDRDILTDPWLLDIINNEKTELKKGPTLLNLSYDQTCNLACPSCRTDFISSNDPESQELFDKIGKEVLITAGKDVERALFCSSGDPFASTHFKSILRNLDFSKNPKLNIQIVTNGVLFNEKNWNDLKNIHGHVDFVSLSIDASSMDTYDIVRKGGDWDKLMDNLKFIKGLRERGEIPFLKFDFVVQDFNYFEMPDFVLIGKKFGADRVFFQKIVNWGTYSEDEFKKRAIYLPDHPHYKKFVEACDHELLKDQIVDGGNLSSFIGEPKRKFILSKAIEHTLLRNFRKLKRLLKLQ
jgi:sulfatase maturation enzyme AslB (radical SAM superfamily)